MIQADYRDGKKLYRVQTRKLPSVSMLISELTGERFEDVPLDTLRKAQQEGTGAHRLACEYARWKPGDPAVWDASMPSDYPGTPDEWNQAMGKVNEAVASFLHKYEVDTLAVEQPSVCTPYGFAGQPDMKAELTVKGKRVRAVIDYKRVAGLSDGHRLQVQAYRLLDGYREASHGFILWLKKGGGYELVTVKNDPHDKAAILAAATLLQWKIKHGKLDAQNIW